MNSMIQNLGEWCFGASGDGLVKERGRGTAKAMLIEGLVVELRPGAGAAEWIEGGGR